MGDLGLIPGLGRSPEKGMATHPSILAWRIPWTEATVHRVTKTRLDRVTNIPFLASLPHSPAGTFWDIPQINVFHLNPYLRVCFWGSQEVQFNSFSSSPVQDAAQFNVAHLCDDIFNFCVPTRL